MSGKGLARFTLSMSTDQLQTVSSLQAPFPWFGGKSRVAGLVWDLFGEVQNYVEPFFGSGAVLLGRPGGAAGIETVNDKDGYVANFWRALSHNPEAVAAWADWPVNENDLHARHVWLRRQKATLVPRLEGDPMFFDAQIAGWWVWGLSAWIGGRFCGESGSGPWGVTDDGQLVHLGNAGQGVSRQLVHLGDAGQGVSRRLVHLGDAGQDSGLVKWFCALAARLRFVRVCCGDWTRICGPTPTSKQGLTAVFLDPPYGDADGRDLNLYAEDDGQVATDVRAWAIAHGDDPSLRIIVCGYDGTDWPSKWRAIAWTAAGGYGNQGGGGGRGAMNRHLERLYCSPTCLEPRQLSLWR